MSRPTSTTRRQPDQRQPRRPAGLELQLQQRRPGLTYTDGSNHTTSYTYDASGNLASLTDPLGNKTTYSYDEAGTG